MAYSLNSTDSDCYEGTHILINKLDIHNEEQLNKNETIITAYKASELISQPLTPNFCFEDYKKIHKHLFELLYDWAGEIRTIDLSKSATNFVAPDKIQSLGESIFKRLQELKYFQHLNRNEFIDEVTDLYHSINMLHPFREGNGRTQRLFFTQWIRHLGYEFDLSNADLDEFMIATIYAAQGVMDPLIKFFDETIQEPIVGADMALQ